MKRARGRATTKGDQRGAALVVVLIFGLGAMTLVLLLMSLTQASLAHETSRHRRKVLHTVLLRGAALSLHELNLARHQERSLLGDADVDPGQDGVGALLRTRAYDGTYASDAEAATPAGQQGVAVLGPRGYRLGYVRAAVVRELVDGRWQRVLLVAAATPDFLDPQETASAKLLVDDALPAFLRDRQAFSVVGGAGGSSGTANDLDIGKAAELTITSTVPGVPAVNVSDPVWHEAFVDAITKPDGSLTNKVSITGSDADGDIVSGLGTVMNEEPGIIDPQLADDMTASLDELARDIMTSQNGHTGTDLRHYLQDTYGAWGDTNGDGNVDYADITDDVPSGEYVIPEGDYYVSAATTRIGEGVGLTGTGNLIVAGDFSVKGDFAWDGNVVVTHERDQSLGENARLYVESGGRVQIGPNDPESVLAVNGGDSNVGGEKVTYEAASGSRLEVNGVFLLTASADNEEFSDHGSRTTVNGVALMLGDGVDYQVESGGGWEVNGSMVLATPEGAINGADVRIKNGSKSRFTFDDPNFNSALNTFSQFVDTVGLPKETFPLHLSAYLERPSVGHAIAALLEVGLDGLGYEDDMLNQTEAP